MVSNREGRIQTAGINAQGAYRRLRSKIESLSEEMDDITSPHGVKVTEFDDEDSMVIAVQRVIDGGKTPPAQVPRLAAGTGTAEGKPKRSGTHG